MANEAQRLLTLKQKIQEATTEKAKAEGRVQELEAQLKKQFGVDTPEAGEDLLATFDAEVKELDVRLQKGVVELEKKYAW